MSDKKILVVGDEGSIRQMMREMITRKFSNISVETVSSGEKAIEKIKSNSYDLIFMDINLGEGRMDGIETMKHIKEIKPNQNVYMMSGYWVEDEMKSIVENNTLGLLRKPFKLEKLFEIIEKYVLD